MATETREMSGRRTAGAVDHGRSRGPAPREGLWDSEVVLLADRPARAATKSSADRRPAVLPSARRVRPVPQAARDLLADAGRGLGRAIRLTEPSERYAQAHLAALRGAAAVLAARARPVRGRRASAWELLTRVAPEFGEWAAFFAAGSAKRQAAQAGITRLIGVREADDMVRQCAAFLDLVDEALDPPTWTT